MRHSTAQHDMLCFHYQGQALFAMLLIMHRGRVSGTLHQPQHGAMRLAVRAAMAGVGFLVDAVSAQEEPDCGRYHERDDE